MIFAKLDVCFWRHKKFVRAGMEAACYWAAALAYLREDESSTGLLEADVLGLLHGVGETKARKLCERLVEVNLFARQDGGYVLLGYATKNETKEQISARRAAVAARVASSRSKRNGNSVSNAAHEPVSNAECNALQAPLVTGDVPGSGSPSGSVSDLGDGDPGRSTAESPSAIRLRTPTSNENHDGCFGDAIRGWHAQVQRGAGRKTTRPLGGELTRLLAILQDHAPDIASRIAWAETAGYDFGRSGETTLNVHRFDDWLGRGRKTAKQAIQDAPEPSEAVEARARAIEHAQARRDAAWREQQANAAPAPPEVMATLAKIGVRR